MQYRLRTLLIVAVAALAVGVPAIWLLIAGFDAIRRDAIDNPPRMDVAVVVPDAVLDFWTWPIRIAIAFVAIIAIGLIVFALTRRRASNT